MASLTHTLSFDLFSAKEVKTGLKAGRLAAKWLRVFFPANCFLPGLNKTIVLFGELINLLACYLWFGNLRKNFFSEKKKSFSRPIYGQYTEIFKRTAFAAKSFKLANWAILRNISSLSQMSFNFLGLSLFLQAFYTLPRIIYLLANPDRYSEKQILPALIKNISKLALAALSSFAFIFGVAGPCVLILSLASVNFAGSALLKNRKLC